jgi:flagellar basal-body rod modification protein FlgD
MDVSTSIDTKMNSQDLARTKMQVDTFNQTINNGRQVKQAMDKNDFLKLLVTQLRHQDPMQPMNDREFIAQMAQFSTLEQMTNMSEGFNKVASLLKSNEAMGLLGKTVDVTAGDKTVSGVVEQVTGGDYPQVLVDGNYYDYSQVARIKK